MQHATRLRSWFCRALLLQALTVTAVVPIAVASSTTIGTVPGLAGSIAAVPVDLSVNQSIRGLGFRLSFDPAALSFFKLVPEGLGADWFVTSTVVSLGSFDITLTPRSPSAAVGRVASLVFIVNPGATGGSLTPLTISGVTLVLPEGTTQPGTGTSGGVRPEAQLAQPRPPFPPDLSAQSESSSTIRLTWSTPAGATSSELFADGTRVYDGAASSHVMTGLAPSTRHCFIARAVGAAGWSAPSREACATTQSQCLTPAVAPLLIGAARGTSGVALSWNTIANASAYRVFRGGEQIFDGTATVHLDTGRSAGTSYCYTVRSTGDCGDGPVSDSVCVTTEAACSPPAAAPVLTVTPVSPNVVALKWSAVAHASSYAVARGGATIFEGASTSAVDVGLLPGTEYCYVLEASNACGMRPSTAVCARTRPAVSEALVFSHFAGPAGGSDSRDGVGTRAGFSRPGSIAVDRDGNAFVADTDNQTIRRISAAGVVTTLAGAPEQPGSADGVGAGARFFGPEGIAIDGAGILYVADSQNATIRRVTPDGVVTTIAGKPGVRGAVDGQLSSALFQSPVGIAVDASGQIYVADSWNQTIRKITPGGQVTTLAGATAQSGSADGTGGAARFNLPSGIGIDATGNVLVADFSNHTIRRVTPAGVVTTVAGLAGEKGSTNATGSAARFREPFGVAVDAVGNAFVADQGNSTIRKISASAAVTTFAGSPDNRGSADGQGAAARFLLSKQVAVDAGGNVWVADTGNSTIRRISPAANVTTIAGTANLSGAADGAGSAARFNLPNQISADSSGAIVVADAENHLVRRVSRSGSVTSVAGTSGQPGATDGQAASARFRVPMGAAVDASGNVWIADSENHTIRRIGPDGTVTTVAGAAGQPGSADGTGSVARFNVPRSVATAAGGIVYVTDRENHTIRKVAPDGRVTTLAGVAGQSGNADGSGAAARFTFPHGLATDAAGNLIVTDWGNHTVRKVTPEGVVTTLAGSPGVGGVADGTGAAARFSGPQGVTVDPDGDSYVSDSWNHTIRKVGTDRVVTTIAGMPRGIGSRDGWGATTRFSNPIGVATFEGALFIADGFNHAIRRGLPCPTNALCLGDGRFVLSLEAKDPRTAAAGSGLPIPQTDLFGYFAIPGLTGNPENPEVFVKLLDGRGVNGNHWVFFGGLTDFEYDLVVTDAETGSVRVYRKPGFDFCGGADTSAFAQNAGDQVSGVGVVQAGTAGSLDESVPRADGGACSPASELCLLGGRFAVSLAAKDPRTGNRGEGLPIPQTDLFGYFAVPTLTSNPDNPEIFVKLLDGRGVNGRYWFFHGGLTDFEATLTVRDTQSGTARTYTKQGGSFCGGADTSAFKFGPRF